MAGPLPRRQDLSRGSRVRQIRVTLDQRDGTICLEVQDDGRGLLESPHSDAPTESAGPPGPPGPRAPSAPNGHFGIRGMQERVQALGGSYRIEGAGGEGTCVRIEIPLPEHGAGS